MARVKWGEPGSRKYYTGLDQGMIYRTDGPGVAWDGLISVENEQESDIEEIYYEGIKLNNIPFHGEHKGEITAYRYPDLFEAFQGYEEVRQGALIDGQRQDRFHLSYREQYGDDINGLVFYRIHVLYNLLAVPKSIEHNTISDDVDLIEFEWDFTAIPERLPGHRPSSHLIFDSGQMDPFLLADVEDILYGFEDQNPTCPSMKAMLSLIDTWDRLIITDNGDGTWTATSLNDTDITMLSATEFEINADNVVYLDADTYEISSSDRIEDDIWPQ